MRKVFIFVLICMIVFSIFTYILLKTGNNKNIKEEKRIDDILEEYLNYEAEVTITIFSNKTETTYVMKQVVYQDISKFYILKPENLLGTVVENNKNSLKITNSVLNVEKTYENIPNLLNNYLFLNTFIYEYNEEEREVEIKDNEIIILVKLDKNQNTYVKYKELYLDAKTKKPIKMLIKDDAKKLKASIIYNNIKI